MSEPVKVVRTAIAGYDKLHIFSFFLILYFSSAIASLCKSAMTMPGGWPEVFNLLSTLANDASEENRNMCFNLLSQVIYF